MTTTIQNLPSGTTATDFWFDSSVANGVFPENRDKAVFSFGQKPLENCIGFQLLGVIAPCSYYVIDTTNNQIQFDFYYSSVHHTYLTSITPGTYNASNIVTQFQTDMLNNTTVVSGGGLASDLVNTYKMAVLVDATTSQMLFYQTVASASGQSFTISFPQSGGLSELLGFQGATTSSSFSSTATTVYDNSGQKINNSTTYALYSPYFVQLSGPLYLILHSSLAGEAEVTPTCYPNQTQADQLETIVVNSNYDGTITSAPSEKVAMRNTTNPISQAEFYFTLGTRTQFSTYDINGNVALTNYLSFNGGSFLIGVRFFQNGRSNNSIQADTNVGDKYTQAEPTRNGSAMVPNQGRLSGNVIMRPRSPQRSSRPQIVQGGKKRKH